MERTECVICHGCIFYLYKIDNMPITVSPTNEPFESDEFINQEIMKCNSCGCIQNKYLIDPFILYSKSHNQTHTFKTWAEHHTSFYNFIINNKKSNTILEIGGSSGVLYKKFKTINSDINYKCLDICKQTFEISDNEYIQANCELYNYLGNEEIVLSHVFEHLYNPNKFIKNISPYVKSVFISIPNMEHLLKNNSAFVIHNEHTYYIDKYFMEYLFSQYGYVLTKYEQFKSHSLFFQFEKMDCKPFSLENRNFIGEIMLNNFIDYKNRFEKIKIKENSFIVPAGLFGQFIYIMCKPDRILGFLDNDISKQNHRVYGTKNMVYSFDKLKETNDIVYIYIYASVYNYEIIDQINSYNKNNIKIITI
jgi:hypothetical protein